MHIVRLYRRFLLLRHVIPTCNAWDSWLMSQLFLRRYCSSYVWALSAEGASEKLRALHYGQIKALSVILRPVFQHFLNPLHLRHCV